MTLTGLLAHINELNDEFTIYCAGSWGILHDVRQRRPPTARASLKHLCYTGI